MARLLNNKPDLFKNVNSIAMKKLSVAALLIAIFCITACTKPKDENKNYSFLGKWMLDKTVEEEWAPINTLSYSDEYTGLAGDSIVFKANGLAYSYEDGDTEAEETEWKLINDSTIRIEFENYTIKKLTDTEFYFRQEDVDQALNEKWVYEVYLKR
jgi:hypothetical protein